MSDKMTGRILASRMGKLTRPEPDCPHGIPVHLTCGECLAGGHTEMREPGAAVVDERQRTHGHFNDVAVKAQRIKATLLGGLSRPNLTPVQREALEMMAAKMARIVCGDASHVDHWRDIAGYAALGGNL